MRQAILVGVLSAQILLGTVTFSRLLPPRRAYPARATVAALAFYGVTYLVIAASLEAASGMPGIAGLVARVAGRALIIACAAVVVLVTREADVWPAVFCCTCGYVMRGLTYGLTIIVVDIAWGPYAQVPLGWIVALLALSTGVVYPLCSRLMASSIEEHGTVEIPGLPMLLVAGMVVVVEVVFELVLSDLSLYAIPSGQAVILRSVHAVASAFILFMEYELLYRRHLERDLATIGRIRADGERQYEMSRETIDALNMKFHDIRHQIRLLGDGEGVVDRNLLDEIAREVRIYDSAVATGNDALDVLLTEKRLACAHEGITLSCIADGEALGFMSPTDLYALLGNALDNAIEAMRVLENPEKRTISVSVRRGMGMASIHVEGYHDAGNRKGRDEAEYSLRTMRAVTEHYGGTLTVRVAGEVIHLNMVLPIPA